MKKLFFLLACIAMSVLAMGQDNQLVWANGHLLYGTPIESIDSLTYDEMEDVDTLHLLLPRTLIKVVHDTVYIHDTVFVETDCGGEGDTPSAGIGVFSVSADKQVTFSQGNLQYHPANDEWRFAENQTDYIGDANANISSTYNGWIDLFGWGTGDNPTNSSTDYNDYQTFVDWGINRIGIDSPKTWRTLTHEEWDYLRYTRTNANTLYGIAQVNGVNGLIFLPDNWISPSNVVFKAGFSSEYSVEAYGLYQTFTTEQWLELEKAGAIFLPAAGYRNVSNMNDAQGSGYYWSATKHGSQNAYCLNVYSGSASIGSRNRDFGRSVRLVKDIEGGGTTLDTPEEPIEPEKPEHTENGHEYVDLGLPSGLKWATCNVGANAPEEYGDYFAWGEVEPKEEYNWSTYKWCNGSRDTQTKYCTTCDHGTYGTVDNKTVLDKEDDAASVNWGGAWRMPTKEEQDELREKCTWTWTTQNGVNGCTVTGPNGNSIFLPAAGYRYDNLLDYAGSTGYCWSSSLCTGNPDRAYFFGFYSGYVNWSETQRNYGQSVRPVCE